MPIFTIHHITYYHYDRPVKENNNQLRIIPIDDEKQEVKLFQLQVSGNPSVNIYKDAYGNRVGEFDIFPPHTELTIDSRMTIQTKEEDLLMEDLPQVIPALLEQAVDTDIFLYRFATPEPIASQAQIENILQELALENKPIPVIASACCKYIYDHFKYLKGITTIETTVDEILAHKSGVCQDFAHVLLQLLRTMHIPARYVSGYICPNKSGMRGEGATHAWVEYYLPGHGWVGLDPTNNIIAGSHHIRLATGINFNECTPIKGIFKGIAKQSLSIYVSVGYEDGHVFEDKNNVKMELQPGEGTEEWQAAYLAMIQQQQ
jgi:transglutaminase-like putative cysteine protease